MVKTHFYTKFVQDKIIEYYKIMSLFIKFIYYILTNI